MKIAAMYFYLNEVEISFAIFLDLASQ